MTDDKDTSGPVFPTQPIGSDGLPEQAMTWGISQRDWFAAHALSGLLAAQVHGFNKSPAEGPFVTMAYELADEMLKKKRGRAR